LALRAEATVGRRSMLSLNGMILRNFFMHFAVDRNLASAYSPRNLRASRNRPVAP
jgi:hypothetical protein